MTVKLLKILQAKILTWFIVLICWWF